MRKKKPFKLTTREYNILNRIATEGPLTLEQLCFKDGKLFPKFKDMLYFLNNELITRKRVRIKGETFTISEKGIQELSKKRIHLAEKEKRVRPPKPERPLSKKNLQKKLKEGLKDNKPSVMKEKEVNDNTKWLEFTLPVYVEKNGRWEFYQKRGEDILEIYHSESEEEIKQMHTSKMMSHIMAAVKEENKREENKSKPLALEKGQNISSTFKKKKDTSAYIHSEVMYEIMRQKLEGISYHTILSNIKTVYDLSYMTVGLYYSRVLEDIRLKSKNIVLQTIQEHMERYEELYNWFNENGYSKLAIKALDRKERLMGLHDGEKVENGVLNILGSKANATAKYNWDKLSKEEKTRMMLLIKRIVRVVTIKTDENVE